MRDRTAKAIDYMLAYSAGPQKLGHIPTPDLTAAAVRWQAVKVQALEDALQHRIDEEGCSPVFAALKVQLWENLQ